MGGRLEKSFTAIGSSVCLGAGAGGAYGLFDGIRQTAMSDMSGRLRRTQVTNYTLKSAASVSNALGSVVVSYSIFHALLSLADDNERLPDEAKSCISGTLTGLMFKSTSGAQVLERGSCGLGPCFPLGFRLEKTGICATLHIAWTLHLQLDFATLHLTWTLHLYLDLVTLRITRCPFPLPSSSSLAISTSSNHNTWS